MPTFPHGTGAAWGVLNATGLRKNEFNAGRAPQAADDVNAGFERGSRWWFDGAEYVCKSNVSGAAVWVPASDESAVVIATEAKATADGAVIDAETAQLTATAADAKATEALEVQARRDFQRFELVDYLDSADMAASIAGQDETRVTAAIRAFHDAWMDFWSAAPGRCVKVVYPAFALAVNDEVFSESFADKLWNMSYSRDNNRVDIEFNGVRFQCKNWIARSAIRTSGFWAEQGITDPVPKAVWRWEQSSPRQFSPQVRGRLHIYGEQNDETDPIGIKIMSWNTANLDRVYCRRLHNIGFFAENIFNSTVQNPEIDLCGYQPTNAGGNGFLSEAVRFSNTGAVVTATEPVFDSEHAGEWFMLSGAGPVRVSARQTHMGVIASVDSDTQITLSAPPDTDVSDAFGSFEAVRGSIGASSNTLTLSAPVSTSLIGRYITIHGCGQAGIPSQFGSMTARVVAHSGDQVTLSHNARIAVSDTPVIVSPSVFIGRSADGAIAGLAANDDVTFDNLRAENSGPRPSVMAVIGYSTGVDFGPGSKFHGCPPARNNFGGNFSAIAYDWAEDVTLTSCIVSHSGNSPRYGRHMFTGRNVMVSMTGGKSSDFLSGTDTAEIYNDIQSNPTVAQIFYGMSRYGGYVANQSLLRLGATGLASQVMGAASRRAAKRNSDGYGFPDHFGDVVINGSLSGSAFSVDGTIGQPANWFSGKAMLVGYGAMSGAVQAPIVTNLDTLTDAHRRVRFNPGAVGSPWPSFAGIVDLVYNGNNCRQEAWLHHNNGQRRGATRHNNSGSGNFTAWTPIWTGNNGTTAQRPSDPLMAEPYFDTTLGLMIVWNGTAWTDFAGNTV